MSRSCGLTQRPDVDGWDDLALSNLRCLPLYRQDWPSGPELRQVSAGCSDGERLPAGGWGGGSRSISDLVETRRSAGPYSLGAWNTWPPDSRHLVLHLLGSCRQLPACHGHGPALVYDRRWAPTHLGHICGPARDNATRFEPAQERQ